MIGLRQAELASEGAGARQRGVALLTAIILVAIAAVVATAIAYNNAMAARRIAATFGAAQALQMAEGAEALAAYVLQQQSQGSGGQQIALNGPWAQHYGPTDLDGAILEAQMEDQQSKFNVNNLVTASGATNQVTLQQFQRLLASLGLETRWAGLLADWIDSDSEPNSPDGAEDSVYLGQTPPYRTANMPITSVSELLALPGFGRDRYNRLVPYIAALPVGTTINVCTASGLVLDALTPGQQQFSLDPQELAMRRQENGCFPTVAEFEAGIPPTEASQLGGLIGATSTYFRLHSWITIGSARFSLYSLMYFSGGQARPILRTFGTE